MKKLRILCYLLVSILAINLVNSTDIKIVNSEAREVLTRELTESFKKKIATGTYSSLILRDDGTVARFGSFYGVYTDLDSWKDIIEIGAGNGFSVGLKKDGTVVFTSNVEQDAYKLSCIYDWKDIVEITVGFNNVVGFKSDGTIVATGANYNGEIDAILEWEDIIEVEFGFNNIVGLRSDGTVVAAGSNFDGQIDSVSEWKDIVDIAVGPNHVVGVRGDGTVVVTAKDINVSKLKDVVDIQARDREVIALKSDGTIDIVGKNYGDKFDVSEWNDIVAISVYAGHMIGLKSDGTVLATGRNLDGQTSIINSKRVRSLDFNTDYRSRVGIYLYDGGTTSVFGPSSLKDPDWSEMVQVQAGNNYVAGLKSDGTVYIGENQKQGWTDIVEISTGYDHTVGLKSDGTVLATGYNYYGECNVLSWTDVVAIEAGNRYTLGLKADGTVLFAGNANYNIVSEWNDIVGISAGMQNPVGLKSDGTIVPNNTLDGSNFISLSLEYNHDDWDSYVVALKSDNTVVYQGENIDSSEVEKYKNIKEIYTGSPGIAGIDYDGRVMYDNISPSLRLPLPYSPNELSVSNYIVNPGDKVEINFKKSSFYYIDKPGLVLNEHIYDFNKVNEDEYTLTYDVGTKDIGVVSVSTQGITDLFSNVLVDDNLFKVIPLKSITANKQMVSRGEEIILTLEFYESVKPNFRVSLEVDGLSGTPQFVNEVAGSNGTIYTLTYPVSSNSTFGPVGVRLHNVIDLNNVVYDTFVEENIFYKVISHQDLNQDDVVDEKDLEIIKEYYNVSSKNQNWRAHYDFNQDGIIDLYDIVLITNQLK